MDLNHPLLAATSDDPVPFPEKQTQLRRLDRALYCQICKEFYHAPVSIACGHSFCSQCIRASLETLKKCPTCGEAAGEGSIRRNRALEEIVDSWEGARAVMITLSQPQTSAGPSRKRPLSSTQQAGPSGSNSSIKRVRGRDSGSSRSQSPVKKAGGANEGVIEVGSSGEVGEEEDDEDAAVILSENDEGSCPLCSAKLPISAIPLHIERGCPPPKPKLPTKGTAAGTGNQKADWKKVFGGVSTTKGKEKEAPMKRITKPNYHLATPAELRAILSTHFLPTTGDKPTLESRVQEWILLYNSNLDTSHPKSLSALRAQLSKTEASKKRDKEHGKDALGEQLATKEGTAQYLKDRGTQFDVLRKEILARKEKEAEKAKGMAGKPIEIE